MRTVSVAKALVIILTCADTDFYSLNDDSSLFVFLFHDLHLHLMKALRSLTEILNFKQSTY